MNAVGVNNRLDELDDRVTDLESGGGGGGGGGGTGGIQNVTSTDGTVKIATNAAKTVNLSIQGLDGVTIGNRTLTSADSRQVMYPDDFLNATFELVNGKLQMFSTGFYERVFVAGDGAVSTMLDGNSVSLINEEPGEAVQDLSEEVLASRTIRSITGVPLAKTTDVPAVSDFSTQFVLDTTSGYTPKIRLSTTQAFSEVTAATIILSDQLQFLGRNITALAPGDGTGSLDPWDDTMLATAGQIKTAIYAQAADAEAIADKLDSLEEEINNINENLNGLIDPVQRPYYTKQEIDAKLTTLAARVTALENGEPPPTGTLEDTPEVSFDDPGAPLA
jgi:tetrahydromethanopterin S-methyltransferase subunit G